MTSACACTATQDTSDSKGRLWLFDQTCSESRLVEFTTSALANSRSELSSRLRRQKKKSNFARTRPALDDVMAQSLCPDRLLRCPDRLPDRVFGRVRRTFAETRYVKVFFLNTAGPRRVASVGATPLCDAGCECGSLHLLHGRARLSQSGRQSVGGRALQWATAMSVGS